MKKKKKKNKNFYIATSEQYVCINIEIQIMKIISCYRALFTDYNDIFFIQNESHDEEL